MPNYETQEQEQSQYVYPPTAIQPGIARATYIGSCSPQYTPSGRHDASGTDGQRASLRHTLPRGSKGLCRLKANKPFTGHVRLYGPEVVRGAAAVRGAVRRAAVQAVRAAIGRWADVCRSELACHSDQQLPARAGSEARRDVDPTGQRREARGDVGRGRDVEHRNHVSGQRDVHGLEVGAAAAGIERVRRVTGAGLVLHTERHLRGACLVVECRRADVHGVGRVVGVVVALEGLYGGDDGGVVAEAMRAAGEVELREAP